MRGAANGGGTAVQETLYLGDMPVGIWKSNARYYIQPDHLNTARAILDQTGTVIWLWKADPFGTTNPTADPDANGVTFAYNLRFPGQYYDQETGLFYNYFRDYDPRTGRYVQSDPIGLGGGLNTFRYAQNSPVLMSDPLGLMGVGGLPPGVQGGPGQNTTGCGTGRGPDFVNFQIDAYVVSVWATFTRTGNAYIGGGMNKGVPNPSQLSASVTGGWLNVSTADLSSAKIDAFAEGYSGGAAGGYVGVGGGVALSPGNGTATIAGIGAGIQAGKNMPATGSLSFGYSTRTGDTGIRW